VLGRHWKYTDLYSQLSILVSSHLLDVVNDADGTMTMLDVPADYTVETSDCEPSLEVAS
jgi:hypothetical protein